MRIIEREMLWRQYSLALDALGEALRTCPDELWNRQLWKDEAGQFVAQGFSAFWYLAYHTLFWIDLYLTGAEEGFMPPAPFDLVEMLPGEILPRVYGREELLGYWAVCRQRCRDTILGMSEAESQKLCEFAWGAVTFAELQLYTMRHVQEHAAQLHLAIAQHQA